MYHINGALEIGGTLALADDEALGYTRAIRDKKTQYAKTVITSPALVRVKQCADITHDSGKECCSARRHELHTQLTLTTIRPPPRLLHSKCNSNQLS